jgi:hypothetical protein
VRTLLAELAEAADLERHLPEIVEAPHGPTRNPALDWVAEREAEILRALRELPKAKTELPKSRLSKAELPKARRAQHGEAVA